MNTPAKPSENPLRPPNWWRKAVIYQIYPRSYQDSNGDGIGDLNGIRQRLPYIAQLGVDTVWLSPFFRSPMKDFGYDVSDYCDVDPLFGVLADFDALIEEAHQLGLRIMIDQVFNHTSDEHVWFQESRQSTDNDRADWYVWADPADDGGPPNNWLSVFGGSAWQWDTRRRQYYLHNFLAEQPDLNFHHEPVQTALLDSMTFWLERGVDGFRLDTANFYYHDAQLRNNPPNPHTSKLPIDKRPVNTYEHQSHVYDKSRPENLQFLRKMRELCDTYGAALLGEIGCDQQVARMVEYTAPGRLHTAYSFELLGGNRDAAFLHQALTPFVKQGSDAWPTWSIGNHDCQRVATRWADSADDIASQAQLKCYAVMQMTLPGTPCLYQGEELGLPEQTLAFEELVDPPGITFWPEHKGRDGCRTPMPWTDTQAHAGFSDNKPWLPVREPHTSLSVATQEADATSLLQFYKKLLQWRQTQPALRGGQSKLLPIDKTGAILEYQRQADGQTLHIRLNLSAATQTLTPLSGECVFGENAATMPAYGYCVVRVAA